MTPDNAIIYYLLLCIQKANTGMYMLYCKRTVRICTIFSCTTKQKCRIYYKLFRMKFLLVLKFRKTFYFPCSIKWTKLFTVQDRHKSGYKTDNTQGPLVRTINGSLYDRHYARSGLYNTYMVLQ